VLVSSFPYAINWTQDNVPAILHMALNSQEEGSALADVLFGDYNPAGRLVQTWPKSLEQLPPMLDYDIRHGRTYMYFKGEPLYPFGYGLSYTTFSYSNLRTSANSLRASGSILVKIDLKNTGSRAGEEVVQLYVKHPTSSVQRPGKELKAFRRLALRGGETRTVTFELKGEQLGYWEASRHQFVVESGSLQIMIGSTSADIKLVKRVEVLK
jgi:beta-glucosidase